ncbi:hypothetical protein MBM09_13595 [Flaviramulus sp. BrNp1-15]|uniref:hypothetical protein n=1 Tax=Flaviramulus sp. BrNp1-15 TaxID=2916754 RepID=UPI001EE9A0E8|nr:hypothetical protein [Flaviramulus sp. BrNp1-15]ULC58941.1 hypothetical protein MBM09_13595 [Flaviramulus sp. BrNp1-15]
MNNDYTNPAFKKLLQKLQEESWQLELLISGFAIFGLFSAFEPLKIAVKQAKNNGIIHEGIIAQIALIACIILIFNLLLHVLLRGLWIGALGLRYVSGDIDYEKLNYGEKFTKYLKKKVGSFDKYIATLENYCSIIFAISFLLIFYVLAVSFTILCIALIAGYIINNDSLPEWIKIVFGATSIVFILLGMLFTFIDFVTQGFLKKKKWLSKIYFPFYWIFSFITLSFLYRPIVYNFLDNKFGKRLSFLLFPLFLILFFSLSLNYNFSNYFSISNNSNEYIANNNNYEDLIDEKSGFIDNAAIQSKVITDNFIKVFVKFSESVENRIFNYNKGLKPEKDIRGLTTDITFNEEFIDYIKRDSLKREYIKTFNKIYYVKIDSLVQKTQFIVSRSKKGNLGFETYISSKNLSEGKHTLEVKRKALNKEKDTVYYSITTIPFWYFKD